MTRRSPIAISTLLIALLCGLSPGLSSALGTKPPVPQRIPLNTFGFEGISARYLLSGASMLTLDYVDNQHLLVTFGVPRLMKRLPGDPPDDEDRVVDAVLLELPSGREIARTEWRFHDIGQYLWNLGNGQFLLRQRSALTTFAPLALLAKGQPFEQQPLVHFDRRIDRIVLSADQQVLTVETSDPNAPKQEIEPPAPPPAPLAAQPQPVAGVPGLLRRPASPYPVVAAASAPVKVAEPTHGVQIVFLRLIRSSSPSEPLVASHVGGLYLDRNVLIPLTSEGYLRTRKPSQISIQLEFSTYSGKTTDLGPFETSCPPSPSFVSSSEFVTFGCRGSEDQITLAGLNLHGDLLWQINFNDLQAFPSIVSAIPAGRFALSRTITTSHIFPGEIPSTSQISYQEVRVLQTYNGKQLLRVYTSPVQRAGQNFALSPDGLALAIIHDPTDPHAPADQRKPAIEIYRLPPLTAADQQQLKAEAAFAPPPSHELIHFAASEIKTVVAGATSGSSSSAETSAQSGQVPESTAVTDRADGSDPSAPALPPAAARPTYGDIPLPPNRKPPTLYTEPREGPPDSASRPDPEAPPATTPSSTEQPTEQPKEQPDAQKPPPPRPN